MPKKIAPTKMLFKRQGKMSLREFASEVGVTAAYLSDLYRGNRQPGPRILKYLGLERDVERVVVYRRNGK